MNPQKTLIFRPNAAGPGSTPEARTYQWTWVSLEGPDAQDFLQRLTTVAAGGLMQGSGSPGTWLNAQGKIRAVFTLWRYSDEGFAFEFDAGSNGHWNSELLQAIDQFTFSEKMTVTEASARGAIACAWVFPFPGDERLPAGLAPGETLATEDELRFCHHGSREFGRAWITIWGRPARLDQWLDHQFASHADSVRLAELEAARIGAVRPRVDSEITSDVNPLEIGLADAVAENKGCYPGQEIIEKIAAIGSPAKRLVQVKPDGVLPGSGSSQRTLADEAGTVIGEITSVSPNGEAALAVVRKTHAREGAKLSLGGATLTVTAVAPFKHEEDGARG